MSWIDDAIAETTARGQRHTGQGFKLETLLVHLIFQGVFGKFQPVHRDSTNAQTLILP